MMPSALEKAQLALWRELVKGRFWDGDAQPNTITSNPKGDHRTERSEGGEGGPSPKGEGTGEAGPSDQPYGYWYCPDCVGTNAAGLYVEACRTEVRFRCCSCDGRHCQPYRLKTDTGSAVYPEDPEDLIVF